MRKVIAEFIGTAGLVCAVVGSGIMAERLAGGNMAIALLANTIATGAALFFLIVTFAPVSGANFNPAVTFVNFLRGEIVTKDALFYIASQISGGLAGTALANVMFDLPPFFASTKTRFGLSQWLGEFVATFGLVGVIIAVTRSKRATETIALAVACYITAAYWFTSSTSFANPAVTIARSFSDTFAGIRPIDAPAFIVAQLIGSVFSFLVFRWLFADKEL